MTFCQASNYADPGSRDNESLFNDYYQSHLEARGIAKMPSSYVGDVLWTKVSRKTLGLIGFADASEK